MATRTHRTDRRRNALSKRRIVETAIEILDVDGESALTFRALAARLQTGSGAIYWHVADKDDLLAAATDDIVARVMTDVADDAAPQDAIRAIALGLFDAIDAHPWVGARLSYEPWRPATLRIFEGIGGRLAALGVPERAEFEAWSALVNYIIGVAVQNAANARHLSRETERATFLATAATHWEKLDRADHPFMRRMAVRLREHDDREQFLAGIDFILAGIDALG